MMGENGGSGGAQQLLDDPIPESEKGQPNGVASLDGDGRVPPGQLPGVLRAAGDGVTNDRAALLAASGGSGTTTIPPGTYLVSSNLTLTGSFAFARGAKLKPANGVTITLDAEVSAGRWHIFDLSAGGTVRFADTAATTPVYPQWWGVVADGTTDNGELVTTVFASAPQGGTVHFSHGTYVVGKCEIFCRNLTVAGEGKGTVLQANGSADEILFLSGDLPTYIDGVVVRDLTLDGKGRQHTVLRGALRMRDCQRSYVENVWITNVKGDGLHLQRSVRNNWFHRLYIDNCGDATRSMTVDTFLIAAPAAHINFFLQNGGDGHNNNYFDLVESLYPYGDHIRAHRKKDQSSPIRQNFFSNSMFHGAVGAPGYAFEQTGVVLRCQNARGFAFSNCRATGSGLGWPLVLLTPIFDGASVNADIRFSNILFGSVLGKTGSFERAAEVNLLTMTDHRLFTGALVRVSGGSLPPELAPGTDYYVIRKGLNTISLAVSREDAEADRAVAMTGTGSGTLTTQSPRVLVEYGSVRIGSCGFDGTENRAEVVLKGGDTNVRVDNLTLADVEGLLRYNSEVISDTNGVKYRVVVDTSGNLSALAV